MIKPRFVICIVCAIAAIFSASVYSHAFEKTDGYQTSPQHESGFCGWSTGVECKADSDCMKGGCSGQVCQSKKEGAVITTCEWRECYNANKYRVSCKCIEGRCEWSRNENKKDN